MLVSRKLTVKMLLALAISSSGQIVTSLHADDCYRTSCYECSTNPLNECSWGLQLAAGIRPISWRHRSNLSLVGCDNPSFPLRDLGSITRFRTFYHLPWQVGGQISYALSCNTNIFAEFNYAQARNKTNCDTPNLVTCCISLNDLVINLSKYKLFEGYVGARYYWDRSFCDRVAFFLGAKLGFIHHKRVLFRTLTVTSGPIPATNDANLFFDKKTSLAAGGHIGWDVCFWGNWSLVFTAEIVASCGPAGVGGIILNTNDAFNLSSTNLVVGSVGTELAFPLTVGIKYNF